MKNWKLVSYFTVSPPPHSLSLSLRKFIRMFFASFYLFISLFTDNATTSKFATDCTCPRPCSTIQYDTSISYARFMSDYMNNYFLNKGMFSSANYARQGALFEYHLPNLLFILQIIYSLYFMVL